MLDVVETAIMEGMPLKTIGGLIGVSPSTMSAWYQAGSEETCNDPLKAQFASKIDECRSKAVQAGVRLMSMHAQGDYRAALELLKVSDPETWNTEKRTSSTKDVTIRRDLSGLSVEELLQLQALEEKAARKALERGE